MKTELIPVIHMVTEEQVIKNVDACLNNDINKIFLINHQVSGLMLLMQAGHLRNRYPELWIGINSLGTPLKAMVDLDIDYVDAIWSDYTLTEDIAKGRNFEGQLFTGLAFKYQRQPTDLQTACEEAKALTDVATTSGTGTGTAASIDKIKLIREYIGDHPLALASGVSAENVRQYIGIVDYLLVASSFTDQNEMIVESKLRELNEILREQN